MNFNWLLDGSIVGLYLVAALSELVAPDAFGSAARLAFAAA